jgi:hypothetical protein
MSTAPEHLEPSPIPDVIRLPIPAGPEPEPTDTGQLVREPAWCRFRAWLAGWLHGEERPRTDLEIRQAADLDRLRRAMWERDCQIFGLKNELVDVQAEAKAMRKQIQYWVAVHERDRAHVERDRALYAHTIALAAPRDGAGRPEYHLGD